MDHVAVKHVRIGSDELVLIEVLQPSSADDPRLSPAERQVARDVVRGWTNGQIAARRGVALRTVGNQIGSIFRKLGIGSRAELAALTRR